MLFFLFAMHFTHITCQPNTRPYLCTPLTILIIVISNTCRMYIKVLCIYLVTKVTTRNHVGHYMLLGNVYKSMSNRSLSYMMSVAWSDKSDYNSVTIELWFTVLMVQQRNTSGIKVWVNLEKGSENVIHMLLTLLKDLFW